MKKIFLLVLLALISISASARKSYITAEIRSYIYNGESGNIIILTGDVPDNIEGFYYENDQHHWKNDPTEDTSIIRKYSIGEILNVLSEYGYEVEYNNITTNGGSSFLLSKEISSGQTISKGDVNTDGEINIADVNEVISLIFGIVREHPEILEQIKKQSNH